MKTEPAVRWHCSECEKDFGEFARLFVSSFGTKKKLEKPITGFSGRILRGVNNDDFITLTDNPLRRVVFLLDSFSLSNLTGLDGKEILMQIGYNEDFIADLLNKKTKFKLVLLPETTVKLATWDNLLDIVQEVYGDLTEKIEIARPILKNSSYEEIMSRNDIAAEIRSFLEITINVLPLFAGDGYTRREGKVDERIFAEYVTVNRQLSDFGAFAIIDLPI